MLIDIVIVIVLVIALITGYQRGVIQPLLAEIFFFGTLLIALRFHDQLTNLMSRYLHINAVLSVAVMLIAAVVLGAVGGAIGGAFHRLEAIRGIDGLLGIFVHGLVALVVAYLALSALVVLDNSFEPAIKSAKLSVAQVNQLTLTILSNPLTAALVDKKDLDALKKAAATPAGANLDQVSHLHQLEQVYADFLQPQLHSSRSAPIILAIGHRIPVVGKIGPNDLKPLAPSPSPTPHPSASPSK